MSSMSLGGRVRLPLRSLLDLATDLIGPALHGDKADAPPAASGGWISMLCLNASIALLLIAVGQGLGLRGASDASIFFWGGVLLLLVPTAGRVAWPALSRAERFFLLLLLTESLFLFRLLYSPTSFVHFDEMLHWISADDILYRHKLFLSNSLLPISPFYPGLEILTTALASLAGVTVFPASVLVIAVLRALFVSALFLFFERLSGSARIAAIACLVYMGCDNFVSFDSMFAYETLGITLCALAMLVEAKSVGRSEAERRRALVVTVMLIASLAITHHASSFVCALYFIALLSLEMLRRDPAPLRVRIGVLGVVTAAAVALPILWVYARGIPVSSYIGPIADRAVANLIAKLSGHSSTRQLFVAADGTSQPLGYRIIGMVWAMMLAAALATGFFRSLALSAAGSRSFGWRPLSQVVRRRWRDSRIVLLSLAAFGFPLSVAFRLSGAGWEIGNRMGSFVFVAVGLVVAVGIVHFWQSRTSLRGAVVIGVAIATVLLGGITIGSASRALRAPYAPGADSGSIEPMAVETAMWARKWLGEGNRFAADRVNRLLLATYGQQDVITTSRDQIDESRIFLSDDLSPDTLYPIREGKIDYLLVDLRISTKPSVLGQYFEEGELGGGAPPPPSMLLKFEDSPDAGRIFDNGWLVVYDVKAMQ